MECHELRRAELALGSFGIANSQKYKSAWAGTIHVLSAIGYWLLAIGYSVASLSELSP
jgi:hypothetical protein